MYNNASNSPYERTPNEKDVIRMTPEEEKIYKECNREAFVKRGIPYGAASATGAYAALRLGFLKSNPKYGYFPALLTFGSIGSFCGIVSHKAACIQKVLDLPNSNLKRQIDASVKKNERNVTQPMGLGHSGMPEETLASMIPELQTDDYQPPADFDTFTGVNTNDNQPSDFYTMEPLDKFSGTLTTYEELRQRNREEHLRSQFNRRSPEPEVLQRAGEAPLSRPVYQRSSTLPFDRDRVPQYQLND